MLHKENDDAYNRHGVEVTYKKVKGFVRPTGRSQRIYDIISF